ncbi:MAG TPA: hypothetical protein VNZ52_15155, partial [Candidatus Thermoplasmatota archaeon]|nr:hypothetical protein [Candidatus Thermoplasmatota archaeon]
MTWYLPAATGLIGLAFAAVVAWKYHEKRRVQDLAWAGGLAAYGLVSLIEAWVSTNPWNPLLYRLYFPLAAANVGLLGLGTLYLLWRERPPLGHAFAALVLSCTVLAATAQLSTPFDTAAALTLTVGGVEETRPMGEWGTDLGFKAIPYGNPARWANLILNIAGGLALIGGAVWSFARTRHPGLALIAVGGLVVASGGSLASLGVAEIRVLAQFLGVALMFGGFLLASRRP